MMYQAIVTKLTNVRKHPNADRIQLATCVGNQVVVGLDHQEGELGVYFPSDGQLSHEMCVENKLYNKSACAQLGLDHTSFGFFDVNRRVRAQAFRGEKSDGFWLPLTYWPFCTFESPLPEGMLSDFGICEKYITKQTRAQGPGNKQRNVKRGEALMFPKHYDTENFQYYYQDIPEDSIIYLTEKLHGTSGRYGYIKECNRRGILSRIANWLGYDTGTWHYLSGSRNVVLEHTVGDGYYGTNDFRYNATKDISLRKGEVIYFELVGDVSVGSPIMPPVAVPKELASIREQYGDTITYRYGTQPGESALYVYRILQMNEDGQGVDLSWPQVKRRCKELGLKTVPEIEVNWTSEDRNSSFFWSTKGDYPEMSRKQIEDITEGPSLLDPSHIREGVAIRVETPDGRIYCLKNKSYTFKVLEGIIKTDDNYVDMEESA